MKSRMAFWLATSMFALNAHGYAVNTPPAPDAATPSSSAPQLPPDKVPDVADANTGQTPDGKPAAPEKAPAKVEAVPAKPANPSNSPPSLAPPGKAPVNTVKQQKPGSKTPPPPPAAAAPKSGLGKLHPADQAHRKLPQDKLFQQTAVLKDPATRLWFQEYMAKHPDQDTWKDKGFRAQLIVQINIYNGAHHLPVITEEQMDVAVVTPLPNKYPAPAPARRVAPRKAARVAPAHVNVDEDDSATEDEERGLEARGHCNCRNRVVDPRADDSLHSVARRELPYVSSRGGNYLGGRDPFGVAVAAPINQNYMMPQGNPFLQPGATGLGIGGGLAGPMYGLGSRLTLPASYPTQGGMFGQPQFGYGQGQLPIFAQTPFGGSMYGQRTPLPAVYASPGVMGGGARPYFGGGVPTMTMFNGGQNMFGGQVNQMYMGGGASSAPAVLPFPGGGAQPYGQYNLGLNLGGNPANIYNSAPIQYNQYRTLPPYYPASH